MCHFGPLRGYFTRFQIDIQSISLTDNIKTVYIEIKAKYEMNDQDKQFRIKRIKKLQQDSISFKDIIHRSFFYAGKVAI